MIGAGDNTGTYLTSHGFAKEDSIVAYAIGTWRVIDTLDNTDSLYDDTISVRTWVNDPEYNPIGFAESYVQQVKNLHQQDTVLVYNYDTAAVQVEQLRVLDSQITFNPGQIERFGNRMFAIGDIGFPNNLYYSLNLAFAKWPSTHFIDFDDGDGDRFVGMVALEDGLALFKNDKFILFRGFRFQDFTANTVFGDIGASAPQTIDKWNREISFLHRSGLYTFSVSGGGVSSRSVPIQDQLDSMSYTDIRKAVGGYVGNDYWLSLPAQAGDKLNTVTWVWNRVANAWSKFSFGFQSFVDFDRFRSKGASNSFITLFGAEDNKIYEYNREDSLTTYNRRYDNTSVDSAYTASFQTKYFWSGDNTRKKVKYIDLIGQGGTATDTFDVTIWKDHGLETADSVGTYPLVVDFNALPRYRLNLDEIVSNVSFVISDRGVSNGYYVITGLNIGYEVWDEEVK